MALVKAVTSSSDQSSSAVRLISPLVFYRTVAEYFDEFQVDDFRDMSSYIIQAHFKSHIDAKRINGRVEFLPIYWHGELHGNNTGVDE